MMKIEIIKPFIWSGKKISVGEVFEYCTAIPEGHYKKVVEVKEVKDIVKEKKSKYGDD